MRSLFFRVALELLSQGLNVILHGRNDMKLDGVRKDLLERFPARQVTTLVLDASTFHPAGAPEIHRAVKEALEGKRLTVLVNNVGFTSKYQTVWEQTPAQMDEVTMVGLRFMQQYVHLPASIFLLS